MGKDLFQYKGVKPVLAVLAILTLMQGAAILLAASTLSEAVVLLFQGEMGSLFYKAAALFLTAFLTRHALAMLKQFFSERFAERTGASLRKNVLDKLFLLGPKYAKKEGTGKMVTLVMEGVAQLRSYLELFLPKMVNLAVIPPMIVLYIFVLDRTSAYILIVTLPILIVFMILLGLAAKVKADRQWKTYRVLSNHFTDSLKGLETLAFLGLSRSHAEKIKGVSDRYRKATMSTLKVAFLSSFALDFFTMLSIATVAVFLGLRLIEGDILLGPALTVLILAPEYFLPVREVGSDYHATLNGQEAGKAMKLILDEREATVIQDTDIEHWSETCTLKLKGVTVKHDENGPVSLDSVNLSCHGLQKIGIVGESGSGKSTLIDVIGGFLEPAGGSIELNEQEAEHLQLPSWQKQLLYIPQHPYVFSDSLAQNIRFYRPEASQEEVEKAAEAAGLTSLINTLPLGLDEEIGEGGRNLSGGQSQRVALARAFLENRQILLLDEPTSHLDIETEYELKKTMLKLFENKLVFLATHRLHWMKEMDRIIVMHEGRMVETGTHEELMKAKGHYYRLACIQWEDSVT
ncbi:thiol reductant ABC exporter subunit CydD [Priestia megaterium]|nr:thiol reductant ABC exporter subunit CydD [Priestia megaterium]